MIETILIANRGEIARRVLRTCREMGIRAIAVYSDADRDLPHVREADLAVRIGPPESSASYLNLEAILDAALKHGADAIHPGYGFLSESPELSAACAEKGVRFIGPPPDVIRAMGDKAEAKRLMREAGIPTLPGYDGEDQRDATLIAEAEKVGFPLMVKAVAGGGGRGIRMVRESAELAQAIESARREALGGFGDDRLMLEKFLEQPRHIEFQIMADSHGRVLHFNERECSIQRRHQKVIEEAPSANLAPEMRTAMAEAAITAARSIGYQGAGTVEFLVEGDTFCFLEMNTRLQVEHPVTELVHGVDLVRLQIEVAAGRPLTLEQSDIVLRGHSIECRLNAENPATQFLPTVGRLERFDFPEGVGRRVDAGFAAGCEITPHYDSLLAKLITWGESREEALRKTRRLLAEAHIGGLETNLGFLQRLMWEPAFVEGRYTTRLLEGFDAAASQVSGEAIGDWLLAASAVEMALETRWWQTPSENGRATHNSIWATNTRWRGQPETVTDLRRQITLEGHPHLVDIQILAGRAEERRLRVLWEEGEGEACLSATGPGTGLLELSGRRFPIRWDARGDERWITFQERHLTLEVKNPFHEPGHGESVAAGLANLSAPLPGKVIRLMVSKGQQVTSGDLLMIVEAMKMEHQITAPFTGTVAAIHFGEGDPVEKDDLLLDLTPESPLE